MHDRLALVSCEENPNMLVPWVLMGAYAYYQLSTPLLKDSTYDQLCRQLHAQWRSVKHRHKWLIDRGQETCMVLLTEADYPGMTIGATHDLIYRQRPRAEREAAVRDHRRAARRRARKRRAD